MMRGRLINPFLAELAQLDTEATAADPDGAGPLTSGYDPDFREPRRVSDGTAAGRDARQEAAHVFVPCQVEPETFDTLRMLGSGNIPNLQFQLTFHFRDLEEMALVDATTGRALIRANDRLVALRELDGTLIEQIPTPPGLYVTRTQSRSFGLSGGKRNLLLVTFEDREQGALKET